MLPQGTTDLIPSSPTNKSYLKFSGLDNSSITPHNSPESMALSPSPLSRLSMIISLTFDTSAQYP